MVQKPGRIFDFYPLEDRILLNGDGLDGADVAADVDPELMTALLAEVEAAGPAAEDPAVATELSATEEADVTSAELADLPAFDADAAAGSGVCRFRCRRRGYVAEWTSRWG